MDDTVKKKLRELILTVIHWGGILLMFYFWSRWFIAVSPKYMIVTATFVIQVFILVALSFGWRWLVYHLADKRKK